MDHKSRLMSIAALMLLALCPSALALVSQSTDGPTTIPAIVVKVVDGDTVRINVPSWSATPFQIIDVRIYGIDTPESRKPPARCKTEVKRGLAAKAYAQSLLQPGDPVSLTYMGHDKYFRIDGALLMPDGQDFAATLIESGMAAPYFGEGPKRNWCSRKPV